MKFTMQPARTAPHIATLISLAGISALTMNIFLPSLPTMTAHFGADYAVMQLSVALYLAVSAALQIVIGPLSDRYGRRPVLLWGLSLFCLATVGTLVAPTTEWFLAARMAQAVMAVGLVLSRAVVRDMVPTDQAASMIGYVTMGMSIVPMIGPGIGGVLEPLQANPTIIEDNCFIGARSEVVEGVIVGEGSVISMGVYIGQSTRIYDRETGEVSYGRIPPYSVVVSGNLPSADGKYSLYCAVIVKKVDAKTLGKVGINELLRGI